MPETFTREDIIRAFEGVVLTFESPEYKPFPEVEWHRRSLREKGEAWADFLLSHREG